MCSGLRGVSNAGTPSTCYMLLFKFFTLQLTKRQVRTLITHADSPYIRCIGFLYLRYVCDPKQLWGWCEPYLHDDEKFSEEGNSTMTTIGEWLRRLLIDQEYHDTMLPRLPVPVAKDHTQKLAELRGGGGSSMSVVGRYEEERDGRGGEERREDARRDERDEPPVNYRDLDQDGYGAPRVVPEQHAPRREIMTRGGVTIIVRMTTGGATTGAMTIITIGAIGTGIVIATAAAMAVEAMEVAATAIAATEIAAAAGGMMSVIGRTTTGGSRIIA